MRFLLVCVILIITILCFFLCSDVTELKNEHMKYLVLTNERYIWNMVTGKVRNHCSPPC